MGGGGVPSFQTEKQFHESMSCISSNHMFFSLYIYDLHGSVMYVKYPSFATSQSARFFIPAKRSIHGGNYSMQSHRFYIPPSCTKTMKQKYPIISAIDDKWRWDCHSQLDDLAVLLHHFSWTHAPTFPHCSFWRDTPRSKTWSPNPTNEDSPSPCAPSAGPLPPADILCHLRWRNTWVRIPTAMRSLSTKGGTRWALAGTMFSLILWYPTPWQALHDNWERTVQSSECACAS